MARPQKYNWESIREAYEKGFTKDEIVKKFRVPKNILTNKINLEKWCVLCSVDDDIEGISAKLREVTHKYSQNKFIEEMLEERINTVALDNELIGSNRGLLKSFQKLIGDGIKDGIYDNPQNIKAGVSAIKDIEAVANPSTQKTEVNVNQTTQVNQNSILTAEEAKEKALSLGVPLECLLN